MAKQLTLEPKGWPMPMRECPAGPFCWIDEPNAGGVCWKSGTDVFNIAGEQIDPKWWDSLVQPLCPVWWVGNNDDGWTAEGGG